MFKSIEDFAVEWEQEAELTNRVLMVLTDDSLGQAIISGRRTLGDVAWHLVASIHYMTAMGLDFQGLPEAAARPDSAERIAGEYRRISSAMLEAVKTQWTADRLQDKQMVGGEVWENGASLRFTLMHQAHHRGQMTVLMRQAGLRIPEVYGPTYDTWVEQGREPLS
ncbi:DinB family protein [Cohnella boryungensis]|uniref:DinB family protein n=1 Tax=Cohnella boryungensis TaxID=768479 RepID=A0ABV8SIN6_9BACL